MVTHLKELWKLVGENYGNSLQRLTITLHLPPVTYISRELIKGSNDIEEEELKRAESAYIPNIWFRKDHYMQYHVHHTYSHTIPL